MIREARAMKRVLTDKERESFRHLAEEGLKAGACFLHLVLLSARHASVKAA
jgi:hypothetical protein